MSQSFSPLTPIAIEDPIVQVNSVDKYGVLESGNQITWRPFSTTAISSSSIQWSCPPPSSNVVVNRSIKALIPVRLTFTGNVSTTNNAYQPATSLLNSGMDAPRFLPLSSAIETLTCTINGLGVSIPLGDVIHPLTRYNLPPDVMRREFSTAPCYRDQSFNYADLVGTARNPLGNYGSSHEGDEMPRGSYPFTIVSNATVVPTTGGTAATAIVDMLICESLYVSPNYVGASCDNNQGFYNVNTYDVNMTFIPGAGNRMWSHSAGAVSSSGAITVNSNITNITVQFNGFTGTPFSYSQNIPQLLFQYITPSPLTKQKIGINIPITYPYNQVARYPTDYPAIAYGAAPTLLPGTNINLSQIPNSIYLCVRLNNATLQSSPIYTDCYHYISNIQFQFGNQPSLLSTAVPQQLYDICVRNNICDSWNQWSGLGMYNGAFPPNASSSSFGGVGNVICLRMGRDVQLPPDMAPGMGGNFQVQVNAYVQNMNSSGAWDNLPITFYMICCFEGTFTIASLGQAESQLNILSVNDVLDAQTSPGITYNRVESGRLGGGNFLNSIGDFASKVNNFLKEHKLISGISGVLSNVPVIGPAASGVHTVSKMLGYGEGGCGNCEGGVAIQGGMKMSKSQLRSRLG